MKQVDVVVLNYNSGGLLERCIRNLRRTRYPIHIIVVDNGSVDRSIDFLEDHPDVTLIRNQGNLGCPGGLNRAYSYLKGDYVAYLNEDIFPYPDWLDHIIPLFEEDARLGAVGMKLIRPDGTIEADGSFIDPITCSAGGLEEQFSEPIFVPYTGLGNIVVRRDVFEEIGLFEDMFFLYWDDAEFCIRLWRAGYKVLHVPRARALHLHRWATRRNLSKVTAEYYPIRNGILTILAYLSEDEIKVLLPYIMLLKAVRIARLIVNGKKVNAAAHILALSGVLRRLDWIIRKRILNNHNRMPLTRISNISPSDPPFFKTEPYLVKQFRMRTMRKLENMKTCI